MLFDPSREFLSANALGLPELIRDALIEVLRKFESGDVKKIHRTKEGLLPSPITIILGNGYNMSVWNYCGTPMCIGGWIEHVGISRLPHDWKIRLPQLYALCHPWGEDAADHWDALTLPQACRAIRHYLVTGDGEHAWDSP